MTNQDINLQTLICILIIRIVATVPY